MKKMKLKTKLIGGFVIVALLTLGIGFIGWWSAGRLAGHLYEVGVVRLPSVDSLLRIKSNLETIQFAQASLLNPRADRKTRDQQYKKVKEARERYKKAWDIYAPLPQTVEEAKLWEKFVPEIKKWAEANNQFFEASKHLLANNILNPVDLMRELQVFRGDHYKLESHVAKAILTGELFEGGDDHNGCAFGRWLAQFHTDSPRLKDALKKFAKPHQEFHAVVGQIKEAMQNGDRTTAQALLVNKMLPAAEKTFAIFREMRAEAQKSINLYEKMIALSHVVEQVRVEPLKDLEGLVAINEEVADHEVKTANGEAQNVRAINLIGMVAAFAIAITLGILISLGITRPLNRVIEGLGQGSQQVASASNQVSNASQSLAQGAAEQAASLEETSSSMEEMGSMTRQNAENAGQADALSDEAKQVVDKANASMAQLTTSMEDITKAGEETGKIIKNIDEIAFQTNLLALNAAVEAARAGEAGAGFAVVADEVRNLAMRAAEAAKNTADLIQGTIEKTKHGSELVARTNQAFSEVVESTVKVGDLVSEIAAASQEQAQGIDQVNKAMSEMDKVTQQNAANAEESAAAAEELSAQAETMQGFVSDLVSLVGSSNGKKSNKKQRFTGKKKQPALPAPHEDTQKYQQNTMPKRNAAKQIPLDEDPDFADF